MGVVGCCGSLVERFAALSDPRQAAKVLHPLPEVLLLLLCATLAGADDFVEVQLWGGQNLAFLRRLLPYAHGVPSHDTLGDVVAALDPALFKACFTSWVAGLRVQAPNLADPEVVAIDGKTSRRSHARAKGREPLHLLSAWASSQRLVLGQEAVSDKSNEITAIPALLQRLELAGALVTIDAMGTQAAVAEAIRAGGGDYLLALKGNRPLTFAEVAAFFADPSRPVQVCQTTDGEHGRIELRRHTVCHKADWVFSDRRYPGEPAFPHLAMIGMVESETERNGRVQHERRYYLGSAKLDAETLSGTWRSTCSAKPSPPPPSRTAANSQAGTSTISPNSSKDQRDTFTRLPWLVHPGDPSRRHSTRPSAHPPRARHRMVALATSLTGRRTIHTPETCPKMQL